MRGDGALYPSAQGVTFVVLDLGGLTVEWLGVERVHFDAGAMFGPVPRLLWEGKYPVRRDNLSPFLATPLLIRTGGKNIIVDTGLGNRLTPKQVRNFVVKYEETVPRALERKGLSGSDIDAVILTHLDWDHAAGIVERTGEEDRELGEERLRYPNAVHVVNEAEWHDAHHPNMRSANTYWQQNWALLEAEGNVRLVRGSEEVAPGVSVHHTGGHTRGHMVVALRGTKRTAYHLADLLPTHAHLNPLWVTAYDNFPLDTVEQKAKWLERAKDERAWLLFYHDAVYAGVRLDVEGGIAQVIARPASPSRQGL